VNAVICWIWNIVNAFISLSVGLPTERGKILWVIVGNSKISKWKHLYFNIYNVTISVRSVVVRYWGSWIGKLDPQYPTHEISIEMPLHTRVSAESGASHEYVWCKVLYWLGLPAENVNPLVRVGEKDVKLLLLPY